MVFAAEIAKIVNARDIHPAFAKPKLYAVSLITPRYPHSSTLTSKTNTSLIVIIFRKKPCSATSFTSFS